MSSCLLISTFLYRRTVYGRGLAANSIDPRSYIASNVIISMELVLSIAMTVAESSKWFRLAGILEWTLGFVGVGYIWAFIGFFGYVYGNTDILRGSS